MITSVRATALAGLSSTKQSSSGSVELHGAYFRGWNKYAGTYPAKMSTVVLIFADGAQIRARIYAPVHIYAEGNEYALTPAASTVDESSRFFSLSISAFWLNGLAFWRLHCCSDFITFCFFILFVYARAKLLLQFFLTSTCEKSYASSKLTRWGKTAFLEGFRPYLDF